MLTRARRQPQSILLYGDSRPALLEAALEIAQSLSTEIGWIQLRIAHDEGMQSHEDVDGVRPDMSIIAVGPEEMLPDGAAVNLAGWISKGLAADESAQLWQFLGLSKPIQRVAGSIVASVGPAVLVIANSEAIWSHYGPDRHLICPQIDSLKKMDISVIVTLLGTPSEVGTRTFDQIISIDGVGHDGRRDRLTEELAG
jgi:hypothetical protein